MKKRLLGLLSLTLCLMLVAMPVMGVAADYSYVTYTDYKADDGSSVVVSAGDLIVPGTKLTFNSSITGIQYGEGSVESIPGSTTAVRAKSAGFWRAVDDDPFMLEDVGYPSIIDYVGEKTLFGFKAELSGFNGSGNRYEHSVIAADFKDFIEEARKGNGDADKFKYVYYDIGLYEPVKVELNDIDSDGAKKLLAYKHTYPVWGSFEFEVDAPDGTDYHVLHWLYPEQVEPCTYSIEGNKIKVEVKSLSPFAVAYIPSDDNTGAGGGNGGNTGAGGGNGGNTGAGGGNDGNSGGVEPGYEVPSASPSVPQTGDNAQLMLWCVLAVLSLTAAIVIKRRKHA